MHSPPVCVPSHSPPPELQAAVVFARYVQGQAPARETKGGGTFGNMVVEYEMPESMEDGTVNTIEKVGP